jgi:putative NIF3 family GTP cyclohydrolase 1 type 2
VFVDQALHDYVQHGGNVVGRHEPLDELKGGLVNALRRFVRDPRRRWRNTIAHASKYYEEDVVPREFFARTLEQRLGYRLSPPRAREVRRVARLSSSLESLGWLVARSAQDVRGRSETLGLENQLIKGIVWHRMRDARARVRRARTRFS